ncbi:MAG: hypothetical protein GY804_09120 [Alphaproteobacteria bacterium]|nr:hypothetical protein [Alphaproteobacteria bacterium]
MINEFKSHIGKVIETIDTNDKYSKTIKVWVSDTLPLNLNTEQEPNVYEFEIYNEKGVKEKLSIKNKGFLIADYFNIHPYEKYPPVIHVGEPVVVFQIGDPDKWYWIALGLDQKKRTTERLEFRIADRPLKEADKELDDTNSWTTKVNTRDGKFIRLLTTNSDGEPVTYDIGLEAKDAQRLHITDSYGNCMFWDSKIPRIHVKNFSGSEVDIDREDVRITAPRDIRISAGRQIVIGAPAVTVGGASGTNKADVCRVNASGITLEGDNTVALKSPVVSIDGTTKLCGEVRSGPILTPIVNNASTPSAGEQPSTEPGSSSDDRGAGASKDPVASPVQPHTGDYRCAGSIFELKPAIDMIADWAASVSSGVPPFNKASEVYKLTEEAKMLHITDERHEG